MTSPRFTHMVLKPTFACTAKCETCSTRKALHELKRKEDLLDNNYWRGLFREANELGAYHLTLSGGEPTLYKPVFELIEEGKKYGWSISMNTNGSLIDEQFATRLIDAGLDGVSVSIYSPEAEFHDQIRRHKGLWQKAVNALQIFVGIRDQGLGRFQVGMQTLICKDNYRDFPRMIQLAYDLKACSLTFSYLEGDYKERKYLLDESQIMEFKKDIIPAAVAIAAGSGNGSSTRKATISALESIYPLDKNSIENYALGIYRTPVACRIPSYFTIILANGDVHPCNMVEYSHYPVVGNLHEKTFTQMWQGKLWADFREKGFEMCQYCSVPGQVHIPIMRKPNFTGIRSIFKNTPLRAIKPQVRKMIRKHRKILRRVGLYPN